MRAPFLLLPITLALAAPLSGYAQDASPRVLFCAGECFAVDAKGTRTPAPKGTALPPGSRLETGPGGYAQVKLSPEAAVGISEQARVRFDRDAVLLDQGRVRMVGGETFGKPIGRPVELRTTDGTIVLRGGDLEARKTGLGSTAATLVRLSAGDARLGKGAGEIQLPPQAVQGIERGKLAGAPIPITDIVPPRRGTNVPVATGPVSLPTAPIIAIAPSRLEPTTTLVLAPTLTTSLTTTYTKTYEPVLTSAEKLLTSTFTTTTGTTATFNDILKTTTATTTTTTDTSKLLLDSSTSLKTIDSSYTLVKEPTLCSTCLKLQTTTTFTR